ncbi:MAG TPA: endonuclease/exonuclease/phosphatase family protein [Vicinamibacterales bacterium]|nr:endonuclease/exonuclease/phosphatase family protein [Vicinamibacterales bacterium]
MKRASLVLLLALVTATAPSAGGPDELVVMTRNQYLGADLSPILTATTAAGFIAAVQTALSEIAAAGFPERAEALADEIVEKRPHLVGLQEVFRFTINGVTAAPPFRDQLEDLLAALAARGAGYYVAAEVRNLDITIPLPGGGVIQATDRDIVLARADVTTWPAPVPGCRASVDGCNFGIVATLDSPVGPIAIERGFVVVDAVAAGQMVRFVNTHLEIPELPRVIQAVQAAELIARLGALANPLDLPVVIAGDINSAPTNLPLVVGDQIIASPYAQLLLAGYLDAWQLRPGMPPGYTCCQASDLLNLESALFKRVDVIVTSRQPSHAHANIVGADPEDRTASGLWPSDHAGVVARFHFDQ